MTAEPAALPKQSPSTPAAVHFEPAARMWHALFWWLRAELDSGRARRVCEVGAGANPTFGPAELAGRGVEYSILDVSATELAKAPPGYHAICADIAAPDLRVNGPFDLVFSKNVAEHVRSGEQLHRNIWRLLAPGGLSIHIFPTLYALPFLVNYWTPERLAAQLLKTFLPRDEVQYGKFPAYYDWCRGPTPRQLRRLESLGYKIAYYGGFFGHEIYYRRLPALEAMSAWVSRQLMEQRVAAASSFAVIALRRPSLGPA